MTTVTDKDDRLPLTMREVKELVAGAASPAEKLANVVTLVGNRMETDVCSIYLLDLDHANLVLAATVGLKQSCIGHLRMGLHEGLAGLVAQEMRPVAVEEAASHPRFKYFPEAGEDAYHSFLGVPLVYYERLQGVLVIQTVDPRVYTAEEIERFADTARQLASVVRNARPMY